MRLQSKRKLIAFPPNETKVNVKVPVNSVMLLEKCLLLQMEDLEREKHFFSVSSMLLGETKLGVS